MGYRSERFDPGDLTGPQQAWGIVDLLDSNHVPIVNEVMAGKRYRRQLHPDTVTAVGEVDYLLQVTLEPEPSKDGIRIHSRHYLNKARVLLGAVKLPGETTLDEGALHGWDVTTTAKHPFGTGTTETETLRIYPPWLQARWEEAGRQCMFFCGIQPQRPKGFMEDWMFNWDERLLRNGQVVFEPTPDGLETW
jgi:hypothetical protein